MDERNIKKDVEKVTVERPEYYRRGKTEVIGIIEDQLSSLVEGYVGFLIGVILQYVCRCLHKADPVGDLQKCKVYIDYLIDHLERSGPKTAA